MTFYAIQIEQCPGFGFQGGAEFDTLIRPLANGRNRRRPRRYIGLHRYVSPMQNIPVTAARAIKRVQMAVLGAAHTFLHVDYLDCDLDGEEFGIGDGVTTVFQLTKAYDPGGGATYERDITKPDLTGAIKGPNGEAGFPFEIKNAGMVEATTISATLGTVTFSSPPGVGASLTATGRFYVPVRFNRDDLPFSIDAKSGTVFITNGTLELIEELNE